MVLSDSLPLFEFEAVGSVASRLDPRVKLAGAVIAGVGIMVGQDAPQFASLAAGLALITLVARVRARSLLARLRPVLLFVIVGGGLVAFTTPGHGWNIGPAHISESGLNLAARLSAQLLLLLVVSTLVTYTTPPLVLTDGIRRLCGWMRYIKVPVEDMATMLTMAITFVPVMTREIDRYLTARAARGADVRRLGIWSMLGDLLVPLLQSNLDRGDELALALDTRLYGSGPRTHRSHGGLTPLALLGVVLVLVWIVLTIIML